MLLLIGILSKCQVIFMVVGVGLKFIVGGLKSENKKVFSSEKKINCQKFIRNNSGKLNGKKLKLIPPNI